MNIVDQIKQNIERQKAQIVVIQEKCCHPTNVRSSVFGGILGTHVGEPDCEWIEYHCGLCGKDWSVDK